MFRFLLSVVAILALTATFASPSQGDETQTVTTELIQDTDHNVPILAESDVLNKVDAEYGVLYAEGRITKLPQDANKFYLTIMGNKNDAKYQQILSWFETEPQLKNIKSQCHFNAITTDMEIYGKRYKSTVPALPCVRMQQSNGKTLFQMSGQNVPLSADALAKGMSTECIFRFRRNRPQPSPDADPAPNPDTDGQNPDDEEEDGAQPDTKQPDTKPITDDHKMTVLSILAAIGIGLALGGGHAFASNLQQSRANHH